MDTSRKSYGLQTFLEHYWFFVIAISAPVVSQFLSFFTRIAGNPWVWCYEVGLFAATIGVALIFYSKLPLYRERRFFTFGSAALPLSRRSFYRWGYRGVIYAVALLLSLYLLGL